MTADEKIKLFERAGITDAFIKETDRLIDNGEFFDGEWTVVEEHEPVMVQLEMDPAVVVSLDRRARAHGMTRSQYITALATS